MERKENEILVNILRKVTKLVKIYPFVYALIYLAGMVVYYAASETASAVVDMLFAVTPIMTLPFFGLSRALKLCVWHRLQCSLPLLPAALNISAIFIDFSIVGALMSISAGFLVFLASLVNAYFVFVKPRK